MTNTKNNHCVSKSIISVNIHRCALLTPCITNQFGRYSAGFEKFGNKNNLITKIVKTVSRSTSFKRLSVYESPIKQSKHNTITKNASLFKKFQGSPIIIHSRSNSEDSKAYLSCFTNQDKKFK